MLQHHLIAGRLEAGCDEAGRGCLAGPVTAAAVILPDDFCHELINDSKQLTERQRESLRPVIEEAALAWAVAHVSPAEIDRVNILRASIMAMHSAVGQLALRPDALLIDGNRFIAYQDIPHTTIVGGDAKMMSIAAASILAKTHRDQVMRDLDRECPGYGWAQNKGYPTRQHREALQRLGLTAHHRRTFAPAQSLTLF